MRTGGGTLGSIGAVLIVTLLAVGGCEKSGTVAVDLRGVTADVAVILTLDDLDTPVRVSMPFGLEAGRVTFGRPPNWTLEGREITLVAVAMDAEGLAPIYGRYGRRSDRPSLRSGTPPDSPQLDPLASLDEPWLEAGIGSAAFVIPADRPAGARVAIDEYPAIPPVLKLRLPVDPEPCAPGDQRRLYPFGPEADGILDQVFAGRGQQQLLAVARLDDRTALVGGPGLYVVSRGARAQRGRPEHTGPDVWIPFSDLWPGSRSGEVKSLSLGPPSTDGIRRGVIAVAGANPNRSWLHEIAFGPSGVTLVRTLAEIDDVEIEDVDLDEQERVAAITEAGRLWVGRLTGADFTWYDLGNEVNEGYAVRWSGQPTSPIVVGVDRAVLVANADLSSWGRREVSVIGEESPVSELATLPDRGEVWAAGSRGILLTRRFVSEWDQIGLELPPRFLECAIPDAPLDQLRTLRNIDALTGGDGYIYFSQENCNAVVALRIEDRCASVLTPDGQPARVEVQSDESDKQLRAAAYTDGQLLMVGDEGRVLTNLPP